METNEATRVMGAASVPAIDRTMVAGAPAMPPAGATQMGVTVTCPVCHTNNSGMEAYCGECGFLLASAPGESVSETAEPTGPAAELVENTSGRRFRLKQGSNLVGRENCDILLMDGTVSRRHAQVMLDGDNVTVIDLGSTNGTQVDGAPLAPNDPTPIHPGSTVRFGNATLTFSSETAPAGAPAEVTMQVGSPSTPVSDQTLVGEISEAAGAVKGDEAGAIASEPSAASAEGAQAETVQAGAAPVEEVLEALGTLRPTGPVGETIPVRVGTFTIGRRAGNDIVIATDPYISGAHALLQGDASGCYLTDVGSTNGTTVNGAKLEPNARQILMDGDEVTIGQSTYRYEAAPQPAPEIAAPDATEPVPHPDDHASLEGAGPSPDEVAG